MALEFAERKQTLEIAYKNEHHEVFWTLLDFGFKLEDLDRSLLVPMATEAALKGKDQTLSALIDYICPRILHGSIASPFGSL